MRTRVTVKPAAGRHQGGVEGGHGAQLRAHGTRREHCASSDAGKSNEHEQKPDYELKIKGSVTANTARAFGQRARKTRSGDEHQHQESIPA